MMVRKGSPQLLAELNAFLARYPRGFAHAQRAAAEIPEERQVREVGDLGRGHSKRLNEVVALMRKYSDQYGMDYLLMAAQGYQESGLDHSRKQRRSAPSASCR